MQLQRKDRQDDLRLVAHWTDLPLRRRLNGGWRLPFGEDSMRMLLLSALLASGVGLTGPAGASTTVSPGIASKAATNFSPRVQLAAKGCREECDQNGDNCHQVCR